MTVWVLGLILPNLSAFCLSVNRSVLRKSYILTIIIFARRFGLYWQPCKLAVKTRPDENSVRTYCNYKEQLFYGQANLCPLCPEYIDFKCVRRSTIKTIFCNYWQHSIGIIRLKYQSQFIIPSMSVIEITMHALTFLVGVITVALTLFSAISTFVLPRSSRSPLTRLVFRLLRGVFDLILHFAKTYKRRDAIMAYYAPIGLMLLLPVWYLLISFGYAAMYWSLGVGNFVDAFRLSGSSLFTLGFATSKGVWQSALVFSEAMLGLIMVALLIAYLPTMYAAFSRREQAVNMLVVRAGSPPSAVEMLLRFRRIHGLDKLGEYWRTWETWFADVEESHSTLATLVFFRSPRPDMSWITAAGAVLDAASLTLSAVDVPYEVSAALCIRAGYLSLHSITHSFGIPLPHEPHFPDDPISISRAEFDETLTQLAVAGLPIKADRDQAWKDFGGWRVNYDRSLIELCILVMAPFAHWSSDRIGPADHKNNSQ